MRQSYTIEESQNIADRIRLRVFDHVLKNNGGYLSQACSSAEIFSALYTQIMNLNESAAPMVPEPFVSVPTPDYYRNGADYNGKRTPDSDLFIFSPSHYGLVLYSTLIETGRMSPEGLEQFNTDGSTVELIAAEHSPGCETTTGSLAQGISQAAGMALGRRLKHESGGVWVFMTDGEFAEGQVWEAVMTMANYKMDSMAVIVDVNGQQCDGVMKDVMDQLDLKVKLEAFGALAVEVNGNDLEAIVEASRTERNGKPLFILCKTDPMYKVPVMKERFPKIHTIKFTSGAEEKDMYTRSFEAMKKEVK
ncbi:MAG: transketolase [Sphaerochaetaceae bacterium]|nr:transketolase [Sphaerochaetaceae bacterium]